VVEWVGFLAGVVAVDIAATMFWRR